MISVFSMVVRQLKSIEHFHSIVRIFMHLIVNLDKLYKSSEMAHLQSLPHINNAHNYACQWTWIISTNCTTLPFCFQSLCTKIYISMFIGDHYLMAVFIILEHLACGYHSILDQLKSSTTPASASPYNNKSLLFCIQ